LLTVTLKNDSQNRLLRTLRDRRDRTGSKIITPRLISTQDSIWEFFGESTRSNGRPRQFCPSRPLVFGVRATLVEARTGLING
jgi:hypothetical protein